MRPLPQSVKDDKEAAVRLIDYFLRTTTARAMSTTLKTASLVLRDSPNVYDPENRISSATGFTYTYDADGNRVQKTNNNTNPATGTLYWHMSPGIVAESDISGALQSEYVFFDGERVARKDFPGSAISYYFSDHLIGVRLLSLGRRTSILEW